MNISYLEMNRWKSFHWHEATFFAQQVFFPLNGNMSYHYGFRHDSLIYHEHIRLCVDQVSGGPHNQAIIYIWVSFLYLPANHHKTLWVLDGFSFKALDPDTRLLFKPETDISHFSHESWHSYSALQLRAKLKAFSQDDGAKLQCFTVSLYVNVSRFVPFLVIVYVPVDVDEGLAVHAVDVEDPVQVVHLVLDDARWPATCLPRHGFTLFIQTWRRREQDTKKYRNTWVKGTKEQNYYQIRGTV